MSNIVDIDFIDDNKEVSETKEKNVDMLTYEEWIALNEEDQKKYAIEWRKHHTNNEIAEMLDVHPSTFVQRIRKLGVTKQYGVGSSNSSKKTKNKIDFNFTENGVIFTGDMNLDELTTRVKNFLSFAGEENEYEFTLELNKKE